MSQTTHMLAEDFAREMRQRWHEGEQPRAEEFLARRPELASVPEAAVELVYEEYCQREAAGQENIEQDLLARFPQWAGALRVMLECHRHLVESDGARPQFPQRGESVGEFRLISELARGGRGRVYLAAQTALAERTVVLKLTPLDGREHLSLARLQHTNIVPLYSVFDDPVRRVRVLCMPDFGRATLAALLESMAPVPPDDRTGRHVVELIDRMQESAGPVGVGAARQMLEHVSYVQAMCWVTACLAEALQFAHERGLVHFDLKPSNVLLAADGQPMLLDFHLARGVVEPSGTLPDSFGGTPPYMPPEQRTAMRELRDGHAIDIRVDARADIYALGAMLYESLGGRLPVTDDSPSASRVNAQVSAGLSDVIARCLAPRPQDRYPDAAALADDLRRHVTNQPLLGVRNRSVVERWRKWRSRQPNRLRALGMLALIAIAAGVAGAALWGKHHDRHEQAEQALYEGQQLIRGGQNHAEAINTFNRGIELLDGQRFEGDLRQQLLEQLSSARRLLLASQIHRLADDIRVLHGADANVAPAKLASLASQCDALWQKRYILTDVLGPSDDADVAIDLKDIALFAADVQHKMSPADPARSLQFLNEAETMFGPSAVLHHQRRMLDPTLREMTLSPAPHSEWEHYALGRSKLAVGDLPAAREQLAAALKLDPAGRWTNFYFGLCAYRCGDFDEAANAFSVCIGAAPEVAGCYYNRALAYAALERLHEALADYDRALSLDPAHATSALNRGMLHFQQGRHDQAKADLRRALEHGADTTMVHFDLALFHMAAKDPVAALQHIEEALKNDPAHPHALQLQQRLKQR
jgi:eukaryotic-like serine/threonine-protein kinase